MDLFSTNRLNRYVLPLAIQRATNRFLLSVFFPEIENHDSEYITFDTRKHKLRLTPFVHPTVAGKVVERQAREASRLKAPYVKDKRRFEPGSALRRMPGEAIGGDLTPDARRLREVVQESEDQVAMLYSREEVMAAEALVTGRVTVRGEGFPEQVVDFRRDSTLTRTLAGNARWNQSEADPVKDLEDNADRIQAASGAVGNVVVMDPLAFGLFRQDAKVEKLLDTRRGSESMLESGPLTAIGGRFRGVLGDIEIWTYQLPYIDPETGAAGKALPDYTLIQAGADVEGVRAYACIQDEKANYRAQDYFLKSWMEEDPAVRWLMLQAAPLPIPYRVDATLGMTVASV